MEKEKINKKQSTKKQEENAIYDWLVTKYLLNYKNLLNQNKKKTNCNKSLKQVKIGKTKTKKPIQGFAIHCHHDVLVEWCYDYDERMKVIKEEKPKSEQKIRLKLFKLLPKEAVKEIPDDFKKAERDYQEAFQRWLEIYLKLNHNFIIWIWLDSDREHKGADRKYNDLYKKFLKATQRRNEAYQKWSQKDKDAFHKKWCGCSNWNGKEILFKKIKKVVK